MATRIQLRRDTTTNWQSNNPVLASGEVAISTDANKLKIGNGSATWTSLSYTDSDKAPINSPTFTGTVTVPILDITTPVTASVATSYWVENSSDGVVRPKTLSNVRSEIVTTSAVNAALATAVGTITSGTWQGSLISTTYTAAKVTSVNGSTGAITGLATLSSPTFTGIPSAPTPAVDTNTTQIATTAYVVGQGYAKLSSPALTGTPTAPTATQNTNTTQLATTAFVLGQANSASATILALGARSAGSSNLYARADHVHPTTGVALLTGANFTGNVNVISPTSDGSTGVRQITSSTSPPTGGSDGDVWLVYA